VALAGLFVIVACVGVWLYVPDEGKTPAQPQVTNTGAPSPEAGTTQPEAE